MVTFVFENTKCGETLTICLHFIRLDRKYLISRQRLPRVRAGICPRTISDPRGVKHGGETKNPAEIAAESLRAVQQR